MDQQQMHRQENSLETLAVMRQQEASYQSRDFLNSRGPLHVDVDVDCRDKMTAWCYQVVNFCKFSRESVEIAMSYLDRFLLTESGQAALADRNVYQLASMTCLYTAIKIHERQAMNPAVVSQLSQNTYSAAQVEEMERCIVNALEWRMNPPTSLAFVRELLSSTSNNSTGSLSKYDAQREALFEIAKLQTELAVSDFKFIATPKSTIAYCAVVNAMESMNITDLDSLETKLAHSIGLHTDVSAIRRSLYQAVVKQEKLLHITKEPKAVPQKQLSNRRMSLEESPRSVSGSAVAFHR